MQRRTFLGLLGLLSTMGLLPRRRAARGGIVTRRPPPAAPCCFPTPTTSTTTRERTIDVQIEIACPAEFKLNRRAVTRFVEQHRREIVGTL